MNVRISQIISFGKVNQQEELNGSEEVLLICLQGDAKTRIKCSNEFPAACPKPIWMVLKQPRSGRASHRARATVTVATLPCQLSTALPPVPSTKHFVHI